MDSITTSKWPETLNLARLVPYSFTAQFSRSLARSRFHFHLLLHVIEHVDSNALFHTTYSMVYYRRFSASHRAENGGE